MLNIVDTIFAHSSSKKHLDPHSLDKEKQQQNIFYSNFETLFFNEETTHILPQLRLTDS